ncbi:exo-beta-N-acetylmuramidase NamZ domain-containing protein [Glaciecola siphonariae]|uniref:Exo-beta-N-acetylmuramidase NamZ domain-containing protein n=1 Tax=Glaciecola siphonariae TaxID=521012 RepID=A0ABV9LX86_9ALTE
MAHINMRVLRKCHALLCLLLIALLPACAQASKTLSQYPNQALVLGAERVSVYLPLLANKRVGLVVNQTSRVGQAHLLDVLIANGIDVKVLFAPEHGVRGNIGAGEHVENSTDAATGVPIQSIYGDNKTPPSNIMQALDVIVFDIQDVGTRFYTYISSMHYMMQAAAKHNVSFIVLDRPNPNGRFVDGPILEPQFQSFVGMHPIPVLHGLSVGELALMIVGEQWIEQAETLDLHVISMQGYAKSMPYILPVAPSPNLPNAKAIALYPSLCFFEASAVSVGRGTDLPFQQIGHNIVALGEHRFTPESRPYAAPNPKLEGLNLFAIDLRDSKIEGLNLQPLLQAHRRFNEQGEVFFTSPSFMDKLAGSDQLRKDIQDGKSEDEIRERWQAGLAAYKQMRQPYLLYPNDF